MSKLVSHCCAAPTKTDMRRGLFLTICVRCDKVCAKVLDVRLTQEDMLKHDRQEYAKVQLRELGKLDEND